MFSLDYRALALFRVGLGGLLLFDVIRRSRDFGAHYLESGVMPLELAVDFLTHRPLFPLQLISASSVWQGGLFVVLGFLAVGILVGAWTRGCTFCAWVLLAAIQARNPLVNYGGDSYLMVLLFWGLFLPLEACWSVDGWRFGERRQGAVVSVGSVAFVVQLAVVYFFGFLSKSGPLWLSGEAVAVVFRMDQYTTDLGRALLEYPVFLRGLTYTTLFVEFLAPVLLFVPRWWARALAVSLIIVLQLGFASCMELGLFPYVSLLGVVPLVRRGTLREKTSLSGGTVRFAYVRHLFCGGALVSMVLWNIAVSQVEFQRAQLESVLPSFLVGGLERLRLDQSWSMFSPDPPTEDGWLVFAATLRDNTVVDLLQKSQVINWGKPKNVSASFGGDRWKAYFLNLVQRRLSPRRVADYFMAKWNQGKAPAQEMVSLQVIFMKERNSVQNESIPERVILYEWSIDR